MPKDLKGNIFQKTTITSERNAAKLSLKENNSVNRAINHDLIQGLREEIRGSLAITRLILRQYFPQAYQVIIITNFEPRSHLEKVKQLNIYFINLHIISLGPPPPRGLNNSFNAFNFPSLPLH